MPHIVHPDLPPPPPLLPQNALFLDFDGTLVAIARHPDAIAVPAGLRALLVRLAERLEGRLALITGRALADLDRHIGLPPGIAVAGSHGGEWRAANAPVSALAAPLPEGVRAALHRLSQRAPGLLFETKPFSAAVHYRNNGGLRDVVLAEAGIIAAEHGLALKHGKMVVELVMPGSDKGSALEAFMQLPPFHGHDPAFAGDDVTDEDAFEAATRLGGGGILVGQQRETKARWRLDGVEAVYGWLRAALTDGNGA